MLILKAQRVFTADVQCGAIPVRCILETVGGTQRQFSIPRLIIVTGHKMPGTPVGKLRSHLPALL